MSCEPDIKELSRKKNDKFIIMGTDGFWEIRNIGDFSETASTMKTITNTTSTMTSLNGTEKIGHYL